MNYKKTIRAAALSAAILSVPVIILALSNTTGPSDGVKDKNRCSVFVNFSARIVQKLADGDTRFIQKREEINNRISEHRVKIDEKLLNFRAKWNDNRVKQFDKLAEKMDTDQEKQALETFKAAVLKAISDRRATVDEIISDFKDKVAKAKADRKAAVDAIVKTYKDAVNTAVEKAKTDCQNGVSANIVR